MPLTGLLCRFSLWILVFAAFFAEKSHAAVPPQGLLREVYLNISGAQISNLTNNPAYPNSPSSSDYVEDLFEAPINVFENYGQRMRGYIAPPLTGDYTFWIATDDQGVLFLSTDENPATRRQIAYVGGWTSSREWEKEGNQRSAPIRLEAGRIYYIEALQKEGGGGDNLAVRWMMPDGTDEAPIPGNRLLPWGTTFGPPSIAEHPANTTGVEGGSATFNVTLGSIGPASFQWRRNNTEIPGANSSTLVVSNITFADQNAEYRCYVSNSQGNALSNPGRLTVTADVTKPTIVEVSNLSDRTLRVIFSEPVATSSASAIGNYTINGGLNVTAAALATDNRTVTLTVSAPFNYGANYILTVSDVTDRAQTPNPITAGSTFSFVPTEYVPVDIGGATAGSTTFVNGGFDVTAGGANVGGSADQFRFDYQQRTGNFDLRVQIPYFGGADMFSEAGLMARETLDANSRFAAVFATPSLRGSYFESRATAGANATRAGSGPVNYPNTWLRLVRNNNSFTGYVSIDGSNWLSLGTANVTMPATLYFGTAVASHSASTTATVQFRNIGTSPAPQVITSIPTRGEPLAASSRRTDLVISEIMYHPVDRLDGANLEFIEIFNTGALTENMAGYKLSGEIDYTFPPGTVLPSGAFLVIAKDPGALRDAYGIRNVIGPFERVLNNDGGTVRLHNRAGAMMLEANYSDSPTWPVAADGAGHSLVLAKPSWGEGQREAWSQSSLKGGSPGYAEPLRSDAYETLFINEILAHTDEPDRDYIEIYNRGNTAVSLAGCFLSDSATINKFEFDATASIPARGFISLTQDQLGFALDAGGETIFLVSPNNARVIDAVRYRAQANGVSSGRSPDGSSRFVTLQTKTPGAANSERALPQVVISEIMFNPISGNSDDEFIELHNRGAAPAEISGWQFTDGITFTFPAGTTIPAGGYLAVAKNLAQLRANNPTLTDANSIGSYDGNLSNSGERVALALPDEITTTDDTGATITTTIFITVSDVEYKEGGRWGQWADGGGSSLELIDPRADPNQPSSWADSNDEAKSQWSTIEFTGVLDNGNVDPDQLQLHLQGGGEALVDDVEIRRAGGANLLANGGFESGQGSWVFQGNHNLSTLVSSGAFAGTRALRVSSPGRGDTGVNRIYHNITPLTPGETVTLRAKVRWLKGHPELLLRLRGNWLEAFGRMSLPGNLGTPGQANSRSRANSGPAIYDVVHSPILPAANQQVTVTARVYDADGAATPVLRYRIDPSNTFTSVTMNDAGTAGDAIAGDGLFSGAIPGQANGAMVGFYVQAADRAGTPITATFPATAPTSECLVRFGEPQLAGNLSSYRIWMSEATRNTWASREVLNNAPLDVTFVYGNHRVIYNVGSLYSGSPWHAGYNGPTAGICDYVVNFRDDELFLGATDFVLNSVGNLDNDDTAQREQATYWIAEQMDIPYNHRRHVHMFVNGQRRGKVYEDAQQPNSHFIEGWFPEDSNGDLRKIEDWFEFNDGGGFTANVDARLEPYTTTGGQLKAARYRWNWRPRAIQHTANDFTHLFALVNAVNDQSAAYTTRVENVADIEEWMRTFCLEHIVGNWDAYGYNRGKNMFAYLPTNGKWAMLTWDIDFTLGLSSDPETAYMFAVNDATIARMYEHAPFRRAYYRAIYDAVNGPLDASRFNAIVDAKYEMLTANGVSASAPTSVKSWVAARRAYLQTVLREVEVPFAITLNNGNNFSTNRNYIRVTGTAPVNIRTLELNGAAYPVTWDSVTEWSMNVPLTAANNVLTIRGRDSRGELVERSPSITVTYTGALTSPRDVVVINEIMYNSVATGGSYIELFNTSTTTGYDLSGYRLDGVDFIFPQGSVIAPNSYMVIVANQAAFTTAYGGGIPIAGVFPGGLDNGGERLKLMKLGATPEEDEIIDQVRYDDDAPWPTAADGFGPSLQLIDALRDNSRVGNWAANTAAGAVRYTPGAANNVRATLTAYPNLWLNEVLPNNVSGIVDGAGDRDPWIELYNAGTSRIDLSSFYLTDDYTQLTKWRFPNNTFLDAGQFLLVWADNEPAESTAASLHTNFRLNPTTGGVALARMQGNTPAVMDYFNYVTLGAGRSVGSYPDGQNVDRLILHYPTALEANDNRVIIPPVTINEWMAGNTSAVADPADNQFEDWFELHNHGDQPVDLSGYFLTDDLLNKTKFRIPNGTVIPAQGFLVVWADEETAQNIAGRADLHASFKLGASGEALGLFGSDGTQIDAFTFGAQTDNVSEGRFPDSGAAPFFRMTQFTPRAANIIPSGNQAPNLEPIANVVAPEMAPLEVRPVASDPDAGQTLAFSIVGAAPAGSAIDPVTGVFTWTPTEQDGPGSFNVTIRVTDNGTPALSRSRSFLISVMEANRAPAFSVLPAPTIGENLLLSYQLSASDPDIPAQPLVFALVEGPQGATVDSNNGRFQWTPTEAHGPGVYPVTVRVTDGSTPPLSDTRQFEVTVLDVNSPPRLTDINDQFVVGGQTLNFTPSASDTDLPAQTLVFFATGLPTGATFDAATGRITWTPTEAQTPGSHTVTLRVTDNGSPEMFAEDTFAIIASKFNNEPTFTPLPTQSIPEEQLFTLDLRVNDDPDQTHTFELLTGPSGLTMTAAGRVSFTPTEEHGPGNYEMSFRATDNGAPPKSVTATVSFAVTEANRAPTLTQPAAQSVTAGQTLTVNLSATDPDRPANVLTYSFDGQAPTGAAIDATTGRVTWTPGEQLAGTTVEIPVKVTDNGSPALSDSKTISLTVNRPVVWQFVSQTGTASSSTLYIYLESAAEVLIDDVRLVAGPTAAQGPNLLPNGDFENATISPWIVSPNHANSQLVTSPTKSGAKALRIVATTGGTTRASSIYQDITPALTQNAQYTLSYWFVPNQNNANLVMRLSGNGIRSTQSIFAPEPPPTILLSSALNNGQLQMTWPARNGLRYQVLFRTTVDAAGWQTYTTVTAAGDSAGVQIPTDSTARFFRVEYLP